MPKFVTPLTFSMSSAPATPASGISSLYALPSGLALRGSDGAGRRCHDIVTGRVASALTNATTTLADLTGISLPVVAGGVYLFEISGTYSTSTQPAYLAMGLAGPSLGASGLSANTHLHVGVGADTWDNGSITAFNTQATPQFAAAAGAVTPWRIAGSMEIGVTGGTFAPQFCRAGSAGTITIQTGAWGWLWRVG